MNKFIKLLIGISTFTFGYYIIDLAGKSFDVSKDVFIDRLVCLIFMIMGWVLLTCGTIVIILMIICIICKVNNIEELKDEEK